ncbi:nitroreductase family protein [Terribacillus saccharophilus]|uniref:NAD(P)H nitroreductase n=1 Tax=Terribacillus saccharophilus TaxID=361277 RepID=A0A075LJ70_9BACI|nr:MULTISPECIES: nitroreductase family protein [Terribacillus]AIF66161.1 NAD(P)H nitroreductase [Terribacillus goriensis]MCM3225157.1 nitroreductase family protein [Terribacillus saccharophilus]MEC0281333.1 nitroreductase family protein [Terribacillus saccharophilus]MEC0289533.1 nitroreductase family protein [Terribacillus saccharophilus]
MNETPLYNKEAFLQIVQDRRSIRTYDENVKISKEEMSEMLSAATKAPSSVNLQPWRFVVIESPEAKAKLAPLARFNQQQVKTSSAVIAVFADMNNLDYLEEIYGKAVENGLMPQEVKDQQVVSIRKLLSGISEQGNRETILIDGGLVSMQMMLTAKAYGYDTNPIGGFEKDQIAEAFDLDKDRYVPVMLLSIGKAADAGYKSYRMPVEQITEWK